MMAVLCIATHAGAANWSKPTFANKGQRSVIVAGCQLTLEQSLLSHQAEQQASIQTTFTLLAATCPVCPYPRALPPAASSLLKPVLNCPRARGRQTSKGANCQGGCFSACPDLTSDQASSRLRALLERGVAKAQHAQHRTSSILGYFCLCLRATFRLHARRPPSCGSAREEGAV